MPAISVITPVYNRPQPLRRALQSVLDQTFKDFEIIVVDDGSTDDLQAQVPALGRPEVRYIRQVNQGVGAARNSGLASAEGEFISFLDSDDRFLPNNLEYLHAALRQAPRAGIAHGWATTVDHAGTEAQWTRPRLSGLAYRNYLFANPNLMGTLLLRRTCLTGDQTFDATLPVFEDWDFWLRLSFHSEFTHVPRRVAQVLFQPVQRTTSQPAVVVGQTVKHIYGKLQAEPVAGRLVRPLASQLAANVHVMMGHQYRLYEGNLAAARLEFLRALRLAPGFWPAHKGLLEALLGKRVTDWLRQARSAWFVRA